MELVLNKGERKSDVIHLKNLILAFHVDMNSEAVATKLRKLKKNTVIRFQLVYSMYYQPTITFFLSFLMDGLMKGWMA